ncbi:cytosolic sulfotransferase 5-like [Lolium perenne]|uniref:cytosolic sulfotransferase 5-like n=1 Tax=Lolium perenne TaxID=4522 RepID=UPI0021EABCEF|nr:cytosolic sulfotransferase 5-like [Lolium perenne]
MAPKAAEEEAVVAPVADLPSILPSLPVGLGFPPYSMRCYRGFWLYEGWLKALAPTHARFHPRPTDVFLATFPKSGTTWLKALAFCILNRTAHPPSGGADHHHPLRRGNPHDLVAFLEENPGLIAADYAAGEDELYGDLPSPRLLSTHLPYSLLPHGITDGESKMVYVCREPKDTLVSFWNFHEKIKAGLDPSIFSASGASSTQTFEEAFELYCQGKSLAGPQWRHVLEYWQASRRRPDHVLFLRYEDMLRHPEENLRRLAAFMGCPFSPDEEAAGVVRDVVQLCSIGTLKTIEVNRSGSTAVWGIRNEAFFRNGKMGDWRNFMTPAMAARLDGIVAEAFSGTGLTYASPSC